MKLLNCLLLSIFGLVSVVNGYSWEVPEVTVNLNAPGKIRAKQEIATMPELAAYVKDTMANWGTESLDDLYDTTGYFHNFYEMYLEPNDAWHDLFLKDPYMIEEIIGAAQNEKVTIERELAAHLSYEWSSFFVNAVMNPGMMGSIAPFAGCSVGLVKIHPIDIDGLPAMRGDHIAIIRSDEWFPDSSEPDPMFPTVNYPGFGGMRNASLVIQFKQYGRIRYTIVGWPGTVFGMVMYNDNILVSLNTRYVSSFTPQATLENIKKGYATPAAVARKIIQTCDNIECALRLARNTKIDAPVFFTVMSNVKAATIARDPEGVVQERIMLLTDELEFMYLGNCDWWDPSCYTWDPRQWIIEYEMSLFVPFTMASAQYFPWSPLSFPFRRTWTIRENFVDLYRDADYSIVTKCDMILVSPPDQFYCTACTPPCAMGETCDEMTGTCY